MTRTSAARLAEVVAAAGDDVARMARRPRVWGVCLLIALIFGAVGPFDTLDRLAPLPRLAYWSAVMFAAWPVAMLHVGAARNLLPARWPEALRDAAGAAAATPALMLGVAALNLRVFGVEFGALGTAERLPVFAAVAAGLSLLSHLAQGAVGAAVRPQGEGPAPSAARPTRAHAHAATAAPPALRRGPAPAPAPTDAPADAAEATESPAILRRLPPARRGALLRLSMQDHYVEIVTDAGAGLALLRLSDAMAEAAPVPGLQVHRSHWVAERAVAGARRTEGRVSLRLVDGAEVPVSRARVAALREAGWLPTPGRAAS